MGLRESHPSDKCKDTDTVREMHFCCRVFHVCLPACLLACQLTSSNGALCIINPLYLYEHGDDWLTTKPGAPTLPPSATFRTHKRDRRCSTTRPWSGAGLHSKRTVSLEQDPLAATLDATGEN